ncbi:response regulator [Schleiferilactobacillus shenzhenensis]|nr:response regulator [Schleiferilactobacillus shenzhenensis]
MNRVIIVDDEYMILRGMQKVVDWAAAGFTVQATFDSPVEALAYLHTHAVDLIISDMAMPEMDGITFMQQAQGLLPCVAFLVLSGYGDFDYVKASLQLGATDYLRKPVDPKELRAALAKVAAQIQAQAESKQMLVLAQQHLLQQLLDGELAHLTDHEAAVLGLDAAAWGNGLTVIGFMAPAVPALADFLNGHRQPLFLSTDDCFVLCCQGNRRVVQHILRHLPTGADPASTAVVAAPSVHSAAAIHDAFRRVVETIHRLDFYQETTGLTLLAEPEAPTATDLPVPVIEEIRGNVRTAQKDVLLAQVEGIFHVLKARRAPVSYVRQVALLIVVTVAQQYQSGLPNYNGVVAALNSERTWRSLADRVAAVISTLVIDEPGQYGENVAAVLDILRARYQEPLQLNEIADSLHLNRTYLGQLFIKETGKSFAAFLNDWRIEQAKYLLRHSQMDVGSVAAKVGYQNTGYFFRQFRKQLGCSPKEYREQAGRQLV